ncbi:MAG: hypothetical protein ACPL7A_01020, partial [Anaerolineales bacterium]
MIHLTQSLSKYDTSFLKIIAKLWGIALRGSTHKALLQELSSAMQNKDNFQFIWVEMPEDAKEILVEINTQGGLMQSTLFERKYGKIRQVGQAKRDREEIYLHPINGAEYLWYRGLIFRDFLTLQGSIEEYIYCPIELLPLIPNFIKSDHAISLIPSHPSQYGLIFSVEDRLVDDSCTLLAWYRKGNFEHIDEARPYLWLGKLYHTPGIYPLDLNFLQLLLEECELIAQDGHPDIEKIRLFLSNPRPAALQQLFRAWSASLKINELRLLPEIECVGDWQNDALSTRKFILDQILSIKSGQWYNLDSFVEMIYQVAPDFQRPSANYDIWIIRAKDSQDFLRGFESWQYVEGRLIRYFLCGPLFWFGLITLGSNTPNSPVSSFQVNPQIKALFSEDRVEDFPSEN